MYEDSNIRPMSFGELFSTGMAISRRTLPTSGMLIIVGYLMIGIIGTLAFRNLFNGIITIMEQSNAGGNNQVSPEALMSLLSFYAVMIPGQIILSIGSFLATAVCIRAAWMAMNDEDATLGQLVKKAFSRDVWYLLAQNYLLGIMIGVAYVVVVLIMVIAGVGAGASGKGVVAVIVVMLLGLAAVGAAVWAAISISLTPQQIVIHSRGPLKGMAASFRLVRGNWWRTFGVLFVLQMIVGVCLSLLMIPTIGAFIDFAQNMRQMGHSKPSPQESAMLFRQVLDTFPVWIPIVFMLFAGVFQFYSTNVHTALFVDLSARKGELGEGEEEGFAMQE